MIHHEAKGGVTVFRVDGKFDHAVYEEISAIIGREAGDKRRRGVVLNMARVTAITSSGISAIVRLSMERPLRVACPAPMVAELLELSGATAVIEVCRTEEAALESFPRR